MLELTLAFLRDVAREPWVAFRAAWIELGDRLAGPRPELGDSPGLRRYFSRQAADRSWPGGRWIRDKRAP